MRPGLIGKAGGEVTRGAVLIDPPGDRRHRAHNKHRRWLDCRRVAKPSQAKPSLPPMAGGEPVRNLGRHEPDMKVERTRTGEHELHGVRARDPARAELPR